MNLFLSPLGSLPSLSFFSDAGEVVETIELQRNMGYADALEMSDNWKSVESLYYISGPASFTSLRNMGVFLQTLQSFSKKQYRYIPISTQQYLSYIYPQAGLQLFSVGKTETFLFSNEEYVKYKNKEISKHITDGQTVGGILSPSLLNLLTEEGIQTEEGISIEQVLPKILRHKECKTIEIEYGANPRLG